MHWSVTLRPDLLRILRLRLLISMPPWYF